MPHLAGYKEMEITGHEIGIVGSMVHNLQAVSVSSMKPSDFNCFGLLRSMWLACDLQEKTVEASCHLLAAATLCQFLLWYKMSLVAAVKQMLKCKWWMGVWCISSATSLSYVSQSRISSQDVSLLLLGKLICYYLVFGWQNVFCSSFTAPVSYEQSDASRQPFKRDFPSVIHSKHAVDEKNVMFTEVTKLWWRWWQMKNCIMRTWSQRAEAWSSRLTPVVIC